MKVNPVSRAILVSIVFFCLWSPLALGQIGEAQPSRQNQRQKQKPKPRQNAVQQQQRRPEQKRDFIVEEGERQARVINNFFAKVKQWSPFIISIFVLLVIGRISLGRGSLLKRKTTSHGSAHFARRGEIKHLLRKMTEPLPSGELFIGIYRETWRPTHKILVLNRELATRNLLVLGPSGSGKSRVIFLTNCYANGGSFIATDPKSELWKYTSGWHSN